MVRQPRTGIRGWSGTPCTAGQRSWSLCVSLMARGYTRAEILDAVCAQVMLNHLPDSLQRLWEMHESDNTSYEALYKFIEKHACRLSSAAKKLALTLPSPLLAIAAPPLASTPPVLPPTPQLPALTWRQCEGPTKDRRHIFSTDCQTACVACSSSVAHQLYQCPDYNRLDLAKRLKLVRDNGRCGNCLSPGQCKQECRSRGCQNLWGFSPFVLM